MSVSRPLTEPYVPFALRDSLALAIPSPCRGTRICALPAHEKADTHTRVGEMLALPIFPASHPASIVGACELNFCVRDGNRWTLTAINTNSFGRVAPSFMSKPHGSNSL